MNKSLPKLINRIIALQKSIKIRKIIQQIKRDPAYNSEIHPQIKLHHAIKSLTPQTVASLVFSQVIQVCGSTGGTPQINIINKIATTIIRHIKIINRNKHKIKNKNKNKNKNNPDKNHQYDERLYELTDMDMLEIGHPLLEILLNSLPNLFEAVIHQTSVRERVRVIKIKPEFNTVLSHIAFNPINLPMVATPKQ